MKLFLLSFGIMALSIMNSFAQTTTEVIIGNANTTTCFLPSYGSYNYGWSAQVYTAEEIGHMGYIDSVYFDINTFYATYTMTNQRMMMAVVPDSFFVDGSMPDSASMTTVWNGNVTWTSAGWNKIDISSNPFYYSGNGNLVIFWMNLDGSWAYSYPLFNATTTSSTNKAKYFNDYTYSNVFPTSIGNLYDRRLDLKLVFHNNNTIHDASVTQITEPQSTTSPIVGSPYDVKTIIKNVGSNTLTSLTINWELNGIPQTPYIWSGSLLQDQSSSEITIGSAVFTNSGENTITVYSTNPDGFVDEQPLNDTLSKPFVVCIGPLAGEYTIDPATPLSETNFTSFEEAKLILDHCGISDTTVFNVSPGSYNLSIVFDSIAGATNSSWVIFQSSTGFATDVILFDSACISNNYIIKLDNAINMEFREMTFKPLNSTYGKSIEIANNSHHINIDSNIFIGKVTNSNSTDRCHIYDNLGANNWIKIRFNEFYNNDYSIILKGDASHYQIENIIENNYIENFNFAGIYTDYHNGIIIHKNYITSNSTHNSHYGMLMYYSDRYTISNNQVYLLGSYGIYKSNCDGDMAYPCKMHNNFVSVDSNCTFNVALYSSSSYYEKIYHNSFHTTGNGTTSAAVSFHNGDDVEFFNNIVSNYGNGYSIYYYSFDGANSDYNDYYTAGNVLGYNEGDQTALSDWQLASNEDYNSVSISPDFLSLTDLHTMSSALNNLGTPVGIAEDIDGDVRSLSTPDIGADEYVPTTTFVFPENVNNDGFALLQNIPNPANEATEIQYTLPEPGKCRFIIRNYVGATLYCIETNGNNGINKLVIRTMQFQQGVYFYSLEYEGVILTRRFTVLH